MTTSGVSFDRAAGFYDATRALPSGVHAAVTDLLRAELDERQPCLEIGVGTGRIALPLAESGLHLVGIDLAPAMMERLMANAGGTGPVPLACASATALPLATSSMGSVLACHVLHLIPDWRLVVDEAMRVMRPGGRLLVDFGGGIRTAPWSPAARTCFERHGVIRTRPGASRPEDVRNHLASGMAMRSLPGVPMTVRRTLSQDLDEWEDQVHSWTWPYDSGQIHAACSDIRRWADGKSWPLDRVVELERAIQWWAFERPDG